MFGATVERQLALLRRIDPDDAVGHAARRELAGEVAEPAAGAGDDDPLAGFGGGAAEGGVGCDAGAEEGGGGGGG